jgi:2'-5' RNA ligase
MPGYIIDIWKDDELVQSVAGKWTDDEAPRITLYYLGYYRADQAQLLRERAAGEPTEIIAEIHAPEGPAAGTTILW